MDGWRVSRGPLAEQLATVKGERLMDTSGSTWSEATSRMSGLADELNDKLEDAGGSLRDIDGQARAFMKDSPFVALAAAVVGGLLLGRLLSRL
jgi:ElaB/YqjD/DUF883 family membrane-anchored ribosome-binding protein